MGLFSLLCYVGYIPAGWRNNLTTMIQKEGKDLNTVGGWRPITIGNLLYRLFSGLIEKRLRSITILNARQKGFVEGNGCYSNTTLMNEIMRLGKKSSLKVAILDISKAFDSIPHQVIWEALKGQDNQGVLERM